MGLCAFFHWFLKKCENNHALLWSCLPDTKMCWFCLIFVSLVCLCGETRSFLFFAHGIHFQRFLNECIKLAVTCSVRAKVLKSGWVTSAWSPSSSTKTIYSLSECHLLENTTTHHLSPKACQNMSLWLLDNWAINNMQNMSNASTKHQFDELENPKQCLNDDNQHTWVFDKKQQPT